MLLLNSHLPPVRVLAAASLVLLLQASPNKKSVSANLLHSRGSNEIAGSFFNGVLNPIIQKEGFVNDMLNGLSYDHVFPDANNSNNHAMAMSQSIRDKSVNGWYEAFYAPWPRSRNWIDLLKGEAFVSGFAKLFKCLVKECGETVLQSLQSPLEELDVKEEKGKQCLASEVLAGVLHSDVKHILEAWENWLCVVLRTGLRQSTIVTTTEWVACVRFAVTGKGRDGKSIPLLQQKIMDCLAEPLASTVPTRMVAKRFDLLCATCYRLGYT